jgi:hypothetical protein
MSYLVAPFCSELEELTYDLVEGAFRQEPSVSIDRLHRHLGLPFGNHDSQIAITLGTGALEILSHGTIESRRRCQSRHPSLHGVFVLGFALGTQGRAHIPALAP